MAIVPMVAMVTMVTMVLVTTVNTDLCALTFDPPHASRSCGYARATGNHIIDMRMGAWSWYLHPWSTEAEHGVNDAMHVGACREHG